MVVRWQRYAAFDSGQKRVYLMREYNSLDRDQSYFTVVHISSQNDSVKNAEFGIQFFQTSREMEGL